MTRQARAEIVDDEVERLEREQPKADLYGILSEERVRVEQRLRDRGLADTDRREVIAAVGQRRVAATYSDADPIVRRILGNEALSLRDRNPRELKRLINLFRFYALVANRRGILQQNAAENLETTFQQVARLSVITIRWPSLLAMLGTPLDGEGAAATDERERPQTVLERLESVAGDADSWAKELDALGIRAAARPSANSESPPPPAPSQQATAASAVAQLFGEPDWDQLRRYLARGPAVSTIARDLL